MLAGPNGLYFFWREFFLFARYFLIFRVLFSTISKRIEKKKPILPKVFLRPREKTSGAEMTCGATEKKKKGS